MKRPELGNNIGHYALLGLYDSLWVWWDDGKFKYAWNEMKLVHDELYKKTRATDDRSMMFLLVAKALDSQVTAKECHAVWDRARKRGLRKAVKAGTVQPPRGVFHPLWKGDRPKSPVSRKQK